MTEAPERKAWRSWLPFTTLGIATALAFVVKAPHITHRPAPEIFAAVALTAAWILWWVTLHPHWATRRVHMTVFFVGLLSCNLLLVWCSPFFGFFTWTANLFVIYALPGRWRIAGAVPGAAITGLSQVGGFGTLAVFGGVIAFLVVVAANLLIAGVMLYVETRNERDARRRVRMIDELAEANTKLEEALRENAGLHAQLLVQAREAGVLDERQRMAGEIHDVLAQGLTGIVTQLEAAEAAEADPGDRDRHLATAKRLARESLSEARRSVQALRPQQLDAAPLPDVLADVVRGWSGLHTTTDARLIVTGEPARLLPEIEATLLRTAQETLANVARHAHARRVALTLSYMEDLVTLDVRDDGAGFDPHLPRPVSDTGGFGLRAMRERLTRIAGTLDVESEPGAGTAISACVPAIPVGGLA
ncbi:sensor histidine kinase [Actinoplanes sp. NBRC 101535]|uniref:sensor histidine kinase n=1 Tax=Actinoplanes sp. NBRC 101535 TaxID=3032196 RepID=UPI0024A511EC|nr:sensor histidine kinase [Actinoplanes sp. NBRC 101535]GLY06158.1 histidine kinase [Actinoplanes sp. NBRC 101535]